MKLLLEIGSHGTSLGLQPFSHEKRFVRQLHGSNWTFVIFGFLNGAYLIFENIMKARKNSLIQTWIRSTKPWLRTIKALISFHFVAISFIFFRASTSENGWEILVSGFNWGQDLSLPTEIMFELIPAFLALIFMDIVIQLQKGFPIYSFLGNQKTTLRWIIYLILGLSIVFFRIPKEVQFIYFEF